MTPNYKTGLFVACIFLAVIPGRANAGDTPVNELPTAASFYSRNLWASNSWAYLLADNEAHVFQMQANGIHEFPDEEERKPALMSGRKMHQYLGLGTVAFAGLTILAAPDDGCEQNCSLQPPRQTSGTTHTRLARATVAMAVATVMTGLVYHWNDIHWEDSFFDPDKVHARLGAAGALLMLYAANKSAKSAVPTSHSGMAELGAATMLVAIKINW